MPSIPSTPSTPDTPPAGTDSTNTETGNVQNYDVRMARMVQEYRLVMNMVSVTTAETVDSGAWDSAATWKDGAIPGDGARVLINKNHTVVINKELSTHLRTVRVEGELSFNPHKNTKLIVDTMVTVPDSTLRIGEPSIPIDTDKKAQIIIRDYRGEGMITGNASSPDYDPLRIGQGILTNGLFLAYGAEKLPYIGISGEGVARGEQTVMLDESPDGWRVGDTVVVLGTSELGNQSEERTITALSDSSVTLSESLEYDHKIAETTINNSGMQVHIANLSRNIIIKTDPQALEGHGDKNNPENVEHRGHVLFMHNNNVNINYIQFKDLGRTNKKYVLNESHFASEDADAPATQIGTNQAARYPVHFHRAGLDGKVGRVKGCVIVNSPGWGYVNHSSNVIMRNNIAYHVFGASFITEAGDENGIFEANMAIETRASDLEVGVVLGDVKNWGKRNRDDDWGFQGNGFWILGPHVDFVDNIVNGSSNSAFGFKRHTIDDATGVIYAEDEHERDYHVVSLKSFVGNVAYANSGGIFGVLNGTRSPHAKEIIKNMLVWNNAPMKNGEMFSWWYPDNIEMDGITIIGDIRNPKYVGIGTQSKLHTTVLRNLRIEGLDVGLRVPAYRGHGLYNIIENAYLNNRVNMLYQFATTNKGANTKIIGDISYGTLPGNVDQQKLEFYLKEKDNEDGSNYNRQFATFNVVYAPNGETPMKLYFTKEQSPDYVVPPSSITNAERIAQGLKPVGGVLLPSEAVEMPGMKNVSGVSTTLE
jgi:hypothetical protein